jgi:hypothetical protein
MDIVKAISKNPFEPGFIVFIFIFLATLPLYAAEYAVVLLTSIMMYMIITVSWTMFSGPTGYISLAPAAFFGIGVYTSAILGLVLPLPVVIGRAAFTFYPVVGSQYHGNHRPRGSDGGQYDGLLHPAPYFCGTHADRLRCSKF